MCLFDIDYIQENTRMFGVVEWNLTLRLETIPLMYTIEVDRPILALLIFKVHQHGE